MLWQGVLFITAFVFSDLIDGQMARTLGRTDDFGAFLDSTLDRFADAAIFLGLALHFAWVAEDRLHLVLSLVCLVMGSVTSYARARGEGLGYDAKTGIAERADRLVAILVMTFFGDVLGLPVLYEVTLWLLAAASTLTVAQRVLLVRRQAIARAGGGGESSTPGLDEGRRPPPE
jgi:CDP-diacylglycerol---glycerol-3-phosphate 3-phosphatidyltransferase